MSKIFESIKVSKEVSDNVDETVKILNIIEEEKKKLEEWYNLPEYRTNIDAVIKELMIKVAKRYKNES